MAVGHSETYREIVEGMTDGVVLVDPGARCVYLNPAAERVLAKRLDEVTGMTVWDAFPGAIGTAFAHARECVMSGNEVQLLRSYFVHGRWYEAYARPTRDGALLVLRDITERLQAEAARRELEQRFRLLVDGVQDYAIILLDVKGRIVTWNRGAQRIMGYSAEEIVGKHFSILYPPEDARRDKPTRALETAVVRGRSEDEGWRVKQDGSLFLASVMITPLYDELGEPSGFAKVMRDITERQRAEDALRASEERLRLAASAGEVGLLEYDPASGELVWDRRCKELWGLRPDAEVNYETWLEGIHPDDRARAKAAVERAIQPESGGELDDQYRISVRDHGERWIALRAKVFFDEGGQRTRVLGTMRDVTEQRELEQLRDLLTGIFAHDLRSPLSAVRVASEWLSRQGGPPEQQKLAEIIFRGADRMTRMIEELMDFTRVRLGGGMPVERERVDLAALCRELVTEAMAAHPGREVRCDIRGDCVGMWDRSMLGRVFLNLLSNAFQHGTPGGTIEVEMRGDGSTTSFAVRNQGPPIPSAAIPTIFDPFRRARHGPRGGTKSGEGLGLGLYIARAVVAAHGGEIDVRSSAEEGTTFSVRLPRGFAAFETAHASV